MQRSQLCQDSTQSCIKNRHKIIQEPTKTSIPSQIEIKEKYRFEAMVHGIRESFLKKVCTVNFWEDKREYSPAKHGEYFNSTVLFS